ncbi:hypothetical protein D934_13865 (plasmid) [Xylella fastidiosa subsp. sandyi Ann-1]|uniref:Uncharacterized protein n=1 Tax=Xylella fastidiosa subsp. sandyi Ann-1 TaxID=155920 RepID=A0A060HFJ7_XYLFS|nr:hypothetical protein D934_13865 [Xylella fastidiosa subsp. sandyi Ann-1]
MLLAQKLLRMPSKDEALTAFYQHYNFIVLPNFKLILFLPLAKISSSQSLNK